MVIGETGRGATNSHRYRFVDSPLIDSFAPSFVGPSMDSLGDSAIDSMRLPFTRFDSSIDSPVRSWIR